MLSPTNYRGPSARNGHSLESIQNDDRSIANQPNNNKFNPSKAIGFPAPGIQRKLKADAHINQSANKGGDSAQVHSGFESSLNAASSGGNKIEGNAQQELSNKFGSDFSEVKVHTDNRAHQLATSINANAFTVDQDIYFNKGQYQPGTANGKRLLAHELTHTIQQKNNESADNTIQREVITYNKETTIPRTAPIGTDFFDIQTAYTGVLKVVLADLIAAKKVLVVTAGTMTWFAADPTKVSQLELVDALAKTKYPRASELAFALYDENRQAIFSDRFIKVVEWRLIGDDSVTFFNDNEQLREVEDYAWMTAKQVKEAKNVFGDAIDYSKVRVSDGGYATWGYGGKKYSRTIGNHIVFREGQSSNMPLMIHELTHVWQYQNMGAIYAGKAVWAQFMGSGYNYCLLDKGPLESLDIYRDAGWKLKNFNLEQQGDIIADYYLHLKEGNITEMMSYLPFINDIK